jgi:hypothetical protein
MAEKKRATIEIENVVSPGRTYRVDADKFNAMKRAFLKVLPARSPGLTADEIGKAVLPHLPYDLFPGGAKTGWWKKAVQLHLEAKQVVLREQTKPLRWHKAQ